MFDIQGDKIKLSTEDLAIPPFKDHINAAKDTSTALKEIEYILNKKYKLNINKNKTNIYDSYHGFEYLGYMFYIRNNKTIIKIKSSNKRRRDNNIKKINYLYKNNYISYQKYFNSMNNYNNSYKYTK